MIRDYCDNTDCENAKEILHKVRLKEDFDFGICYWCDDCINRDKDMIEDIYIRNTMMIDIWLNEEFGIK